MATLYRDQRLIGDALAKTAAEAERRRPEIEQRLASIRAEIARAEQRSSATTRLSPERCEARLTRLQARLDDLRGQEADLSLQAPHEAEHAPTAADLAAVADHLDQLIADAEPQKAKALLRLLIEDLRVNGRREILPTYRVVTPEVCASGLSALLSFVASAASRRYEVPPRMLASGLGSVWTACSRRR